MCSDVLYLHCLVLNTSHSCKKHCKLMQQNKMLMSRKINMSSQGKNYDITYKVLVVGEMSVGKTSIIRRYSRPEEKMAMSYLTTVGNCKTSYFTVLYATLWTGQESFINLRHTGCGGWGSGSLQMKNSQQHSCFCLFC